ncbi:MAG: integrase arm-type DNA-binding domain-containing protein [Azoarcus sp.]|jgi:integrase|nr:integrase arm-type DNA-binding domain-containing protein [Azoarcus sp.]
MAGVEKLTALKVTRISKAGKHSDGKGLYLQVTRQLVKSWIFRYERDGIEHYMGMGPVHSVSLAEAREEARKARLLLQQGIDPLQHKAEVTAKNKAVKASNKIFQECMVEYIENHKESWRSEKHRKQWEATLLAYACPHFGKMNVRLINTALVLQVLEPIWKKKTETASRLRERIERILSWAATKGYREGENPARWHGHLEEILPKPAKIKKGKHYPSLPYMQMGAFWRLLRLEKGIAARALEFTILTACRTGEVIFAKWDEFDFAVKIWVIPAERMKAHKEHRVPLVDEMLVILNRMKGLDPVWVFPGAKNGKPISNMAMLNVLERMQRTDITVHGFRSTFRVWAAEQTHYPKELPELALAHSVGTAVENAYQRSDLFELRRAVMKDWADWCKLVQPSQEIGQRA